MADVPDKQTKKRAFPNVGNRFKPGQSGNPKGRPKKEDTLVSLLKDELEKVAIGKDGKPVGVGDDGKPFRWKQVLAATLVRLAAQGHRVALKELWDRVEGRVPFPLEHSGKDGGPIEVGEAKERLKNLMKDEKARAAALAMADAIYGDDHEGG